jgi:type I restriction enzyme M protein
MLNANFQNSGLRQKVDQLMNILYAGGVNNPMDSIEQLSYLLFLRLMSESDDDYAALSKNYKRVFSGKYAKYAWGNFVTLTGDQLFDSAREAIEKLHELPSMPQTGKLLFNRATLKIYDRPTLRAVIQVINEMDLSEREGVDLKGDMYEYLLNQIATSGTNGQFRTPRHIIDLIVKLVNPQPGKRIVDPACGTAGFLVAAFNHIKEQNTSKTELQRGRLTGDKLEAAQWKYIETQAFTGFDNDANMVKIAILNLYLHRLEKADIRFFNPLTQSLGGVYPSQQYDYVLANPPFSGAIQKESILEDINLSTRDTEKLFLKWFIDHLAPEGRCGIIVPNGILFGSDKASLKLREMLLKQCNLQAVITLPSGTFKPYAGVATAILIFEKKGSTKEVWFYELSADGFSMTDTRTPIKENDIPDILARFPKSEESEKSFRVPVNELVENNFELMPARYKAQKISLVSHDNPAEVIDDILKMENEIQTRLANLRKQVKA